jgi:hypothetical protein
MGFGVCTSGRGGGVTESALESVKEGLQRLH